MQAGRSGKLCQTADGAFNLARSHHHQVRKLVYDDHDLWQFLLNLFPGLAALYFRIKSLQIADIVFCKKLVALLHLGHGPVQGAGRFLRVRDNRDHKMRDPIVYAKLHNFRIHQDKFHFIRIRFIDNAHDQRVDAHGFTGACRSGDKQMGHLRDICNHRLARDVFSDRKCDRGGAFFKFRRLQKVTEHDRRILLVRDLNAYRRLPRDRRFDPQIRHGKVQLDIIRQADDPADFHALVRLQFIPGDRRAAACVGHMYPYAEILKGLFQLLRRGPEMGIRIPAAFFASF